MQSRRLLTKDNTNELMIGTYILLRNRFNEDRFAVGIIDFIEEDYFYLKIIYSAGDYYRINSNIGCDVRAHISSPRNSELTYIVSKEDPIRLLYEKSI